MLRVGGVGACALRGRLVPRRLLRVDPRAWRAGGFRGLAGSVFGELPFFLTPSFQRWFSVRYFLDLPTLTGVGVPIHGFAAHLPTYPNHISY